MAKRENAVTTHVTDELLAEVDRLADELEVSRSEFLRGALDFRVEVENNRRG